MRARSQPPRRPRRPPSRRAYGSRAAAGRRGATPTTGGSVSRSWRASSSSTAQAKLGSSLSGSAPPPTRPTVSSTSPPTARGQPLGPRAHCLERLVQHPQHRHLAQRPLRVEVEPERPLERRQRELVRAQRALERVPPQRLDEVGAADDDPGLRAAEQLVAGEADEIGARRPGSPSRTARPRGAPARPSRGRRRAAAVAPRDRRELGDRRLLGEADDAEVRLVHAQEHGRLRADRPLVVGGARAVRRARPRAAARRSARARPGSGSRRRSRSARRARRAPRAPRPAPQARAAPRPRCC